MACQFKVLLRCEKRGVARRAELDGARSAPPASALRQRTVSRTGVGGGMQLHDTDSAHVHVIASWNLSALLTALQSEQSAERRVRSELAAETALMYRKQQRPQRSRLSILVDSQLMRLASAPCTTDMLLMSDQQSQVWRWCCRDSASASVCQNSHQSRVASWMAVHS